MNQEQTHIVQGFQWQGLEDARPALHIVCMRVPAQDLFNLRAMKETAEWSGRHWREAFAARGCPDVNAADAEGKIIPARQALDPETGAPIRLVFCNNEGLPLNPRPGWPADCVYGEDGKTVIRAVSHPTRHSYIVLDAADIARFNSGGDFRSPKEKAFHAGLPAP
jgi:hypothetical protein